MSRARQSPSATCAGYDRKGIWVPCQSPALPVGRGGRCTRCDQLQRADALARADQFPSINDVVLPSERPIIGPVAAAPAAPKAVANVVPAEPMATLAAVVEPVPQESAAKP